MTVSAVLQMLRRKGYDIQSLLSVLLNTSNDVHGNTLYASSDVYARNGAYLRALDAGNTKQANMYHDGTDMQIDATSGDIKIHGNVLVIDRTLDKVYVNGAEVGASLLSTTTIDVDKDWNAKSITNMNEISVTKVNFI